MIWPPMQDAFGNEMKPHSPDERVAVFMKPRAIEVTIIIRGDSLALAMLRCAMCGWTCFDIEELGTHMGREGHGVLVVKNIGDKEVASG